MIVEAEIGAVGGAHAMDHPGFKVGHVQLLVEAVIGNVAERRAAVLAAVEGDLRERARLIAGRGIETHQQVGHRKAAAWGLSDRLAEVRLQFGRIGHGKTGAIDQEDRIRSANRAFFEIFPEASIGAFVREKFGPDDAMHMLEAATSTQVHEAAYRGRWMCASNTPGVPRTFDVYSSPLAIDGDRGQIVSLVDVTEAAEAERVVRRNESLAAMGQATAQVAHEIKNPLGSIRLGVSMLRDSVRGDEEALRTIDLVERGVTHLNKLVLEVTEFSRQKPLTRTNVELDELLNRSLELVSERISHKSTPVERNFSELKLRGSWEADQLVQVFVNVIANAVDASPSGSAILISTELVRIEGAVMAAAMPGSVGHSSSRGIARVIIVDHGSGMEPATRERIFEPFFSTKKRGTGLGLAIVKQIIERHGGHISAASEEGKGSQFTIDLPL